MWLQYKDHPVFIAYMNRKVAEIRLKTNCFDLASMFIKPLQRVLKYPLLLQELLKVGWSPSDSSLDESYCGIWALIGVM